MLDPSPRPSRVRVILLLVIAVAVVVVGQAGRDLLEPDDTREAEVAREMLRNGDYVTPTFAGLPFVEKPSGFPAVVATAFRVAGGPSVGAARAVAAGFAVASIVAVFLLGRRLLGAEGGALCAALLALSGRFCRTAHEILLDNALTAALAFALFFASVAFSTTDARVRRLARTACAFAVGTSFLFKGFVGPALFAAGLLVHALIRSKWRETRRMFSLASAAVFLAPIALWVAPFVARAPESLQHEFFVDNYLGRALSGYLSHSRPPWFYVGDLWGDLAPTSLLLPFAAAAAWRTRRDPRAAGAAFFLAFAAGPLVLLSASTAKDSVYLLPAAPAMALLAGWWWERALCEDRRASRIIASAAVAITAIAAATLVVGSALAGASPAVVVSFGAGVAFLVAAAVVAWRGRRTRDVVVASVAIAGLGWTSWFTGPLAPETHSRCLHRHASALVDAAGGRQILLYGGGLRDGMRGAMSFYADRTAIEVDDATDLVARLDAAAAPVAVVRGRDPNRAPPELAAVAAAKGTTLHAIRSVPFACGEFFTLIEASRDGRDQ
jgi:4-amino-4-deoxy-L-arabinose transferase-like glycosyltransferase